VVDLVENKFTGSSCAVGFLNPADVKLRAERTADETITDADAMRSKGNDAFKARDFTAALLSYQASVEALSSYKGKLDDNIRKNFLDCFLKSLGNTAQCFLRQPEPNLVEVINYASEVHNVEDCVRLQWEQALAVLLQALNLDPSDATGNKSKNLLRRGEAHFRLRNYDEAIEDLKNECLAKNAVRSMKCYLANMLSCATYSASAGCSETAAECS
jgi:tetratricopeptide (TPR) repeat protein